MKSWRVGSFSMGTLLVFLGILLVLTQHSNVKAPTLFLSWWPIVLIVLGIEILIFIYLSRRENSFIKYDFLSIIFVSFIGMIAIGMTALMSMGMFEKVHAWSNVERTVGDLPEYDMTISEDIKRIVVTATNQPLTIEDTVGSDVHIFGIYSAETFNSKPAIRSTENYLSVKEKGNTLYVTIKDVYSLTEPLQEVVHVAPTILLPTDVQVEIEGSGGAIQLNANNIQEDWLIKNAYDVNLFIHDSADLITRTSNVSNLTYGSDDDENENNDKQIKFGNGQHHLSIINTENLIITTP